MTPTLDQPEAATDDLGREIDQRTLQRYVCGRRRTAQLIARPNFQAYQARIHDFSMRGIGLMLEREFPVGTLLAIQLRSAQAGLSCILTAEVRHSTPLADGLWLVGCRLSRSLTDDEVFALL